MANAKTQMGVVAFLGLAVAAILFVVIRKNTHHTDIIEMATVAPDPVALPHAVNIDVFIDGSGSIRNFLQRADKDTRPNTFKALLGGLEDTLAPGGDWQTITPHFFLFGDKVVPVPGTPAFLSEHPEAFHMGTTHIEAAIGYKGKPDSTPEPPPELKIIVTDLYEDQGETARVAKALAAFLQPGPDGQPAGAVGVLGFRNPFSGAVSDLSSRAPGKLPGAADSMPFYILLAGSSADVRRGVKALLDVPALHTAADAGEVLQLVFDRPPQPRSHAEAAINPKSYTLRDKRDDVQTIALEGNMLQATWSGPPTSPGHTPALGAGLKSRITVRPANGSAAVSPCDNDKDNPLCLQIDPRGFDKPETYLIRLDLNQTEASDALLPSSPTLANWNIEREEADRIAQEPKVFPSKPSLAGQHPGLTPGLSELLRALQKQMFSTPVPLTSFHLYVETK